MSGSESGAYVPPPTPRCTEHDTDMQWLDGSPLPGYSPTFRPIGWSCPCEPGHAFIGRDLSARTDSTTPDAAA